jgi:threonine dehydratase
MKEEKQNHAGKRIGIVLTGGNVDRERYMDVLAGTIWQRTNERNH